MFAGRMGDLSKGMGWAKVLVEAAAAVLGYWAPWNRWLQLDGSGPNAHLWGVLSVQLSKLGVMGISAAFEAVLAAGIVLALAGALLRTASDVKGGGAGWLGVVLHMAALALLMPLSGAVLAVGTTLGLEIWWNRAGLEDGAEKGWLSAVLREAYLWGVVGSFAVAGWGYDAGLLVRCVVVSAGVGLVVRGAMLGRPAPSAGPVSG